MAQIDELRQWRSDSLNAHMYTTSELVSTKILEMSSLPDDAYWLSQTYYGMGEYLRGAELILDGKFEQESMKCRYIAALCLLRAQKLDRAREVVEKGLESGWPVASAQTPLSQTPLPVVTTPTNAPPPLSIPSNGIQSNGIQNPRVRVVSTSSLRAGASGARTISNGSRISVIFSDDGSSEMADEDAGHEEVNGVFIKSQLHYLLGRIHTLQSRFVQAKASYVAALRVDARCFDAFAQLTKYHSITPLEEWELLHSLSFSPLVADFGRSIYALRLSALAQDLGLNDAVDTLVNVYQIPPNDTDMLAAQAEHHCTRGMYSAAYELFCRILSRDPLAMQCYTSYSDCLMELSKTNELYKIAHMLSSQAPSAPQTWYVIGVYYLSTQRTVEARRYFSRASLLDPGYASAWIAFAQTFAEEHEHEQAITALSTAVKLFPGYTLPHVYIGMQYLQLLNLTLAVKYLEGADAMFDQDPLVLNELGLVRYYENRLPEAVALLVQALEIASSTNCDVSLQVGIKTNLGFALRRNGEVETALEVFKDVAQFTTLDVNVLSVMALCYMQLEQFEEATFKLGEALAINRDDPVANDLMKRAVKATAEQFDVSSFVEVNKSFVSQKRTRIN